LEAAVPAEEPAVQVEANGELTLKAVTDSWKQVLTHVRSQNRTTEALLNSARLLGVKGNIVYLGLSEVLKQKLERPENLDLVNDALQRVLGLQVTTRCLVSTGKSGKLPPDVESDGMVAAALRDLGGEIVDIN
jgi:hypothetical protein